MHQAQRKVLATTPLPSIKSYRLARTGADSATKFTKALSDIPNTTAGFADRFAAFNAETERLKAAAASAASASKELGTQLQDVGAKASSATPKVAGMHSGLLGFIGGIGAGVSQQILSFFLQLPSEIIATSDAYQRLDARLGMVTKGMATASEAHAALLDVTTLDTSAAATDRRVLCPYRSTIQGTRARV